MTTKPLANLKTIDLERTTGGAAWSARPAAQWNSGATSQWSWGSAGSSWSWK